MVEDAVAAANRRLAIAEDVVGKTDTGHELLVLVIHAVDREARVTREHHAGRQARSSRCCGNGELGGARVGRILGGAECGLVADLVVPGRKQFPAQAIIQGEAMIDLPTVLGIDGREVTAVVGLLEFALDECG